MAMKRCVGNLVANAQRHADNVRVSATREAQFLSIVVDDDGAGIDPAFREDVRYVYIGGQLHNKLSPQLAKVVGGVVPPMIGELLARHGLSVSGVKHWAVHPGGENVINALRDTLGFTESQLRPTRQVLANYGNMSSPTVWFVLQEIQKQRIEPGQYVVMLAFGAGLSAHAMLLQA
jgi:predicted naringenin-chalcone synthase